MTPEGWRKVMMAILAAFVFTLLGYHFYERTHWVVYIENETIPTGKKY